MTLKIDALGRVVIPKQVRDRLGLKTSTEIEVVYQPDGVLLTPSANEAPFSMENGLLLYHGIPEKNVNWDSIIDDAREERIKAILS